MNGTKVKQPKRKINGKDSHDHNVVNHKTVALIPVTVSFVTLSPDKKTEFSEKVAALKTEVGQFKITDDITRDKASELLTRIKKASKILDSKRVELVTPINDEVSKINNDFKFIKSPLVDMETMIKDELKRDHLAQEKIRIENERILREEEAKKLKKLEKKIESKDVLTSALGRNESTQIQLETQQKLQQNQVQTTIRTESGKTQFKKTWKWEITDFNQLPSAYKMIDEVSLNKAVREGAREIPGVRIYEDILVAGGK